MIPPEELRHVVSGPRPDEQSSGAGLITVSFAGEQAELVPQRSRDVMAVVLGRWAQPWPSPAEWAHLLPEWFVQACLDESQEELQAWLKWRRTLDPPARAAAEATRPWSLDAWLSWLEPDERQWFWWDGVAQGDGGQVVVEVPGWPAPFGALVWLLRAAGASSIVTDQP